MPSIMEGWKYRSRELLEAIVCHKKSNKKVDRLCMKFSSVSNTSVQRCLYPLFQNHRSHFLLFHLFFCCFIKECLKPQVRINKEINEHTVDYHPSPSSLTSRIHHLIFLWTPKGFISPEYFLIFFFKPVYLSPWLMKIFKFKVLRLLENTFVSQKIESVHFYSCTQAKLSSRFLSSQIHAEGTYLFLPNKVFWKSIFRQQKRGENYGAEKMTKIKLARILVTSFDKFHHFCNLYVFGFCFAVP